MAGVAAASPAHLWKSAARRRCGWPRRAVASRTHAGGLRPFFVLDDTRHAGLFTSSMLDSGKFKLAFSKCYIEMTL